MDRTLRDISEEWLVVEAQCGDAQAWRMLVEVWDGRLRHRAARHLGAPGADVVQDVWMAVARGLRTLDDPARFAPWVYRILARRCADEIRRAKRSRRRLPERGSADAVDGGDEVDALRLALGSLDPEQRLVISMHYGDGLSVRVIASVLGIAEGTVKSRLRAGREALRARINES